MSGRLISRRRAIVLGGLGVVGLATGAVGWMNTSAGTDPAEASRPSVTGADLLQPVELTSEHGRLQVELVAATGVRLAGRDTAGFGFNGTSPGPTLRVRPGDELAVRLVNRLDRPTNLHTHGLRVSPQANSDNPFVRVDPGDSFDYLYRIPPDHPAGTHWYHPHHHGNVADQLFAGLAGALLVDVDQDLPVTAEQVLLVTDTTLDSAGHIVAATAGERMMGREGALVLVNGQHQPAIAAVPGASLRWRIINACVSRVMAVRLEGHGLTRIAARTAPTCPRRSPVRQFCSPPATALTPSCNRPPPAATGSSPTRWTGAGWAGWAG
ncbi:multicopper oxidase family protein [Pseudonocardia sp. CA-107938]|uniref:multicopper oxidase family protein n=1 Tax=Pseudonocardia sp. CA-107938 TaxID=3240021 RepID=UPI003D918660